MRLVKRMEFSDAEIMMSAGSMKQRLEEECKSCGADFWKARTNYDTCNTLFEFWSKAA